MGRPIQQINISIAIMVFESTKGIGGVALRGKISKMVTSQAKIPYNNPAAILFLPIHIILG